MGTNLDIIAIGDFVLFKEEQEEKLSSDYKSKFKPD